MKVYIASDHGGYRLKETLREYLTAKGYEVKDLGNKEFDKEDDYPDFIIPLAQKVSKEGVKGIVLGRSGNGEAIAANKVKGVRAALCLTKEMAEKARKDNNANIVSIGADFIEESTAKDVVDTFLETPFSKKERHKRRIEKITSFEE